MDYDLSAMIHVYIVVEDTVGTLCHYVGVIYAYDAMDEVYGLV